MESSPAHVLVFPWPLQGHINCMLHLAAALLDSSVHVTRAGSDPPATGATAGGPSPSSIQT
nr:unnamed protein product [Digitaria exilis]